MAKKDWHIALLLFSTFLFTIMLCFSNYLESRMHIGIYNSQFWISKIYFAIFPLCWLWTMKIDRLHEYCAHTNLWTSFHLFSNLKHSSRSLSSWSRQTKIKKNLGSCIFRFQHKKIIIMEICSYECLNNLKWRTNLF